MARAVFVAALTGVTPYQDGRRILEDLHLGSPPDQVLRDHAVCYPAAASTDAAAPEPLYPDRLAEDFLALSLPGHQVTTHAADPWTPSALARLLSRDDDGAAPPHVSRALTFLIAAADRWPHVGSHHLYPLLKADLPLILDGGGSALSALAESQSAPLELLANVFYGLPRNQHTDLAPGIATLTERLVLRELKIDHDPYKQARLLLRLADAQSNAGHDAEALRYRSDALPIMRRLAAG